VSQTLTVNIKLHPTKAQQAILERMMDTYIRTANQLVAAMVQARESLNLTSKHVTADLPSAVKNQAIQDAKSMFKRAKKKDFQIVPVLKKPYCTWNNQNYSFDFESVSLPTPRSSPTSSGRSASRGSRTNGLPRLLSRFSRLRKPAPRFSV